MGVDEVDRLRLKVLHAAAEEALGFKNLNRALLEFGDLELSERERDLLFEYANMAEAFAKKRSQVLDSLVEPYVRQMRERML